MGRGAWRMGHGAWSMGHGAWGMGRGAWSMASKEFGSRNYLISEVGLRNWENRAQSTFSAAADLKSGQFNRNRNSSMTNVECRLTNVELRNSFYFIC
jgi:hypothetical protein